MIRISSFEGVRGKVGIKIVSVALKEPAGIRTNSKVWCLCPTWSMVIDYKSGKISEDEYVEMYRDLMRERWSEVKRWLDSLNNDEDVYLCCWEKDGEFCHRHLVAKMIMKWRKDIVVIDPTLERRFNEREP